MIYMFIYTTSAARVALTHHPGRCGCCGGGGGGRGFARGAGGIGAGGTGAGGFGT